MWTTSWCRRELKLPSSVAISSTLSTCPGIFTIMHTTGRLLWWFNSNLKKQIILNLFLEGVMFSHQSIVSEISWWFTSFGSQRCQSGFRSSECTAVGDAFHAHVSWALESNLKLVELIELLKLYVLLFIFYYCHVNSQEFTALSWMHVGWWLTCFFRWLLL